MKYLASLLSHDVAVFLTEHHPSCFDEHSPKRNKDGKRLLAKLSKKPCYNGLRVKTVKLVRSHHIWGIF